MKSGRKNTCKEKQEKSRAQRKIGEEEGVHSAAAYWKNSFTYKSWW